MSTTHAELFAAAQKHMIEGKKKFAAQSKKETGPSYLTRLLEHTSEIPEATFDEFSDEAKKWYADAAEAFNSKTDIPAPEGFTSVFATPVEKPAKAEGEAAEKTEKLAKAEKAPTAEKGPRKVREHNPNSIGAVLRRAVIADQSISVDEAIELLKTKGHAEPSRVSVSSYVGDIKETLRIAAEMEVFVPVFSKGQMAEAA
jgi:hypothetical protein